MRHIKNRTFGENPFTMSFINKIKSIAPFVVLSFFVLLPLLSTAQTELVSNGNFANSGSWTRSGDFYFDTKYSSYRSKPGYAYVANSAGNRINNAYGYLYQEVTIPSNTSSATLEFYYSIKTDELSNNGKDELTCLFSLAGGKDADIYLTLTNNDKNSQSSVYYNYYRYKVPSKYLGKKVRISFLGTTNSTYPTVFRIDDVSLKVELNQTQKPDIITWNHTVSPQSVFQGDNVSLSCTHGYKTGSMSSRTKTYVRYYLSDDQTWDSGDDQIGSDYGYLSSTNTSDNESFTYSVPNNLKEGSYYILFRADDENAVDEGSGEGNNVMSVALTVKKKAPTTGILNVSISPQGAIDAGALWQIDNDGSWRVSGIGIDLPVGEHIISYKGVSGWDSPDPQKVNIVGGGTVSKEGKYISNLKKPEVVVDAPNVLKTYESGDDIRITATISGDFTYKEIQYSSDGVNWGTVVKIMTNNPYVDWDWELPDVNDITYYQFKVLAYYGSGQNTFDVSDELIRVIPASSKHLFNPYGVSSIHWPFEIIEYSWKNQGRWVLDGHFGVHAHQALDHFSVDGAVRGYIDWKNLKIHSSTDLTCNTRFYSPIKGKVIQLEKDFLDDCDETKGPGGYGNYVAIQSSNNYNFIFLVGHLNRVYVELDQEVEIGTEIGRIGSTGNSTGPHTHCVLYKNVFNEYTYLKNTKPTKLDLHTIITKKIDPNSLINFQDEKEVNFLANEYSARFLFNAELYGGGLGLGDSTNAQMRIFPNPNQGTFRIIGSIRVHTATLYSFNGKLMQKWAIAKQSDIEIHVPEDLPSGFYILECEGNGQVIRKKVFIK